MPVVSVRIPQLGEGLQEARLIEFLKQPGDTIRRDDPIYVMETDKATTEVESPYDGRLVEWLVQPDTVLPIGAEIARMDVAAGTREMAADHRPSAAAPTTPPRVPRAAPTPPPPVVAHESPYGAEAWSDDFHPSSPPETSTTTRARGPVRGAAGVRIPPRTRRYLLDRGLLEMARHIPAAGTKLMPTDVDQFLTKGGPEKVAAAAEAAQSRANEFVETTLPSAQQTLNYRMARGAQVALPAVLETDVDWQAIDAARDATRDTGGPTGFAMLLWCIAQAMKDHAAFRSSLSSDGKTLRTYHHVNLGVAVALPGDVLKTAVVRHADTYSQVGFFEELSARIAAARDGQDQVDATTTVTVSNIGAAGMRVGIPVVVTPAVATLALGELQPVAFPSENGIDFQKRCALTMSFDHRLMNGVGAANFLNDIRARAATFQIASETA